MHHHTENEERAVKLSVLTVSRPGEFSRVEWNGADGSNPGDHQQNMTCACLNRYERRTLKTRLFSHVCNNERNQPVNTGAQVIR